MKKLFYLLTIIAIMSCSDSSNTNFGKTIADYVQTKKNGTKYDLKFKVLEMEEQGVITVGDSITYLTEEFYEDKEHLIKRFELVKKMDETMLAKEKRESDIKEYKSDIAVMEYRIDSLKKLTPDNLVVYNNRNPKDILVKIIRCKYSVTIPNGTTAEETFDFYLSVDGKKCYGKKRVR